MNQVDKTKEPSPCLKVLVISTVGLGYEGITSVILNNVRAMDRTGLEIHIAETIRVEEGIRKQFTDLGCRMVKLPDRKKETLKYFQELTEYIRKNRIDAVHANGNSATLAIEMLAAALGGCKRRIAHSHSTGCENRRADKMLRPLFYLLYTDGVACGREAGKWLYGNRKHAIIKNGRDLSKFSYDPESESIMRNKLGLKDEPVFAHVGGLVPSKNHQFLLAVFAEISKKSPNARLFLVGDGPLRTDIEEQAERLGIRKQLVFTGNVNNVNDYLQAFNTMIMPSFYEGVPLAVLEWQLNGLPCLISDVVSDECVISDTVRFCSLDDAPEKWAEIALKMANPTDRISASDGACETAKKKGYNITDCAMQLKSIYLKGVETDGKN